MSEIKKTSLAENGLIWFGAGVSIAEILTGTYYVGMKIESAVAAILIGHVIGCILLFLAGVIGGRMEMSAMETVKMSFGKRGGLFFAFLNVLQLLGWTAIMIYDGAISSAGIFGMAPWIFAVIIGALIIIWILIGIENLGKINVVAMSALFVLTVVLCFVIAGGSGSWALTEDCLSFGAALELSIAMPLSWLPLISDYTRTAKEPVKASAVSAIVYGIVSCWMYGIGMAAASFTAESDIAAILLKAGLGIAGLVIIVFSTVTTTFLDAWSAGISNESIVPAAPAKYVAIITTILGTIGACIYPMDNITDFLYLIGSVFAPMIAIQIADFFFLKRKEIRLDFDIMNIIIWVIGFVIYRFLMTVDLPVGSTLPAMAAVMVIRVLVSLIRKRT